jgi:hypothetical protein
MPEESPNPAELLAILRGFLPETMREQPPASIGSPPTQEELFDLVEGRLSATEREDLIERIAAFPEAQEALADILAGIELSATMRTESDIAMEATKARWLERIHTWFSPPVLVPVLSVCLLLLVALPMFQQRSTGPGSRNSIRSVEEGLFTEEATQTPTPPGGIQVWVPAEPTPSPSPTAAGEIQDLTRSGK